MSDKKNTHSSDLETNLAKIANAKPRRLNRKDNIYERFITRVENVDSVDNDTNLKEIMPDELNKPAGLKPLKNASRLSSYEPLSAAELELFAIQNQDNFQKEVPQVANSKSAVVSLNTSNTNEAFITKQPSEKANTDEPLSNDSDRSTSSANKLKNSTSNNKPENDSISSEKAAYIVESIDIGNSNSANTQLSELALGSANNKAIKSKNKQVSSKKPLVIGMVFGSLLIAAIVLTLIFTGVLSTANAPIETNSTAKPINDSANTTDTMSTADSRQGVTVEKSKPSKASTPKTGIEDNPINNEQAITYQDFREESQNTLYRETND